LVTQIIAKKIVEIKENCSKNDDDRNFFRIFSIKTEKARVNALFAGNGEKIVPEFAYFCGFPSKIAVTEGRRLSYNRT